MVRAVAEDVENLVARCLGQDCYTEDEWVFGPQLEHFSAA